MLPWLDHLLDCIAPRRCLSCGRPGPHPWCADCGEPLPLPGFESRSLFTDSEVPLLVAGVYEGALAKAIRRFKYEPRPELAAPLARLLLEPCRRFQGFADTAWIPVPLHFERLVERGFNQSALLARELARETQLPLFPLALERRRETEQQAKLNRAEREHNVRQAFIPRGRLPESAILVDDVVTTGATLRACADVLGAHGVRIRGTVALARTLPDHAPSRAA